MGLTGERSEYLLSPYLWPPDSLVCDPTSCFCARPARRRSRLRRRGGAGATPKWLPPAEAVRVGCSRWGALGGQRARGYAPPPRVPLLHPSGTQRLTVFVTQLTSQFFPLSYSALNLPPYLFPQISYYLWPLTSVLRD